jgi:hypothetical protein
MQGDVKGLGHNYKKVGKEIETSRKQLITYPKALSLAIAGAYTYDYTKRNKGAYPPADLVSEFFINEIQEKADVLISLIDETILPRLMTYEKERVKFGEMSSKDEKRLARSNHMIKGFYAKKDTFLHAINELMWATNPKMKKLHDSFVNCQTSLDKNGGVCHCDTNTWLRGQKFHTHPKRMIGGWEGNHCSLISGYFQNACEEISWADKDKWTVCPMNKYWTGVVRDSGAGLDQLKYKCCAVDYHAPLQALPDNFKISKDRYSFQLDKQW